MIVTLTENARIEFEWPSFWALSRRKANDFALAAIPGIGGRRVGFEPSGRFESLLEAFSAAVRLGIAPAGQPVDIGPMRRLLETVKPGDLPALQCGFRLERKGDRLFLWAVRDVKPRFVGEFGSVREAVAQAVWEVAGRRRVTLKPADVGEFLAGVAAELLAVPATAAEGS